MADFNGESLPRFRERLPRRHDIFGFNHGSLEINDESLIGRDESLIGIRASLPINVSFSISEIRRLIPEIRRRPSKRARSIPKIRHEMSLSPAAPLP